MFKLWQTTYQNLTKSEKRFIFLVILFVLLLTLLPLFFGLIYAPKDQFYTNNCFIAGADRMVYFSQIEEARQGQFLFKNLYSSEPQSAVIFSPLWLALGQLSKITTLSTIFIFHLARVILAFIFLLLLYLFLTNIFKKVIWRRIVFLILALGSGLGIFTFITVGDNWKVEFLFGRLGTDFWISEGNTFLSLYHSPLFIISQLLILIIFWWAIERLAKAKWLEVIFIGILTLFLGIVHPYDLFIISSVIGVWFIARSLKLKKWFGKLFLKLAVIGLIASVSAVYYYWLKLTNEAFDGWLVQNITVSPKILNYSLGYGIILLLFLIGIFKTIRSENKYLFFLTVWSIVGWFLLYLPIQFQRRLANGLHIPLAIVAGVGLICLVNYYNKNRIDSKIPLLKYVLIDLMVILLVSSNLYIVGLDIALIINKHYPQLISKEQYQGANWLKNNVLKDEIILSSSTMGNIIPAFSGRTVFIGHGHQTKDWQNKKNYLSNFFFFTNNSDEQKKSWLTEQRISYLYYGPQEKLLGNFNPFEKKYLEPVWPASQLGEPQGEVAIFKVIDPAPP